MFLTMNGRLARANTSAEIAEPEAITNSRGRPASSPVPMSSRVDSDSDTLFPEDHQDLITSDRVLEIVSLQRDEEPEKEHRKGDNNLSLTEGEGRTKTAIRASATSTVSSTASTKSLALPPLTNEQVNKSKFLIGSTSFFDSFFGLDELDRFFPDHKLHLSIVSWNMSSKPPDDYQQAIQEMLMPKPSNDQQQWTSRTPQTLPEVYAIGFQETPKSETIIANLKIGIQASLGPNYALLQWSSVGVLHASIWIRRELLWSCTSVDTVPIHSRPTAANRIRTKGAVALSFSLFGTSFLFINTHLSAHETNLRTRINQLDKVQQILNLKMSQQNKLVRKEASSAPTHNDAEPDKELARDKQQRIKYRKVKTKATTKSVSKHSEYVFWFGDLNFRLELPVESVYESIRQIASFNGQEKLLLQHQLMRSDQLTNLMTRGVIFEGFREAIWPPPFLPTYKCKVYNKASRLLVNERLLSKSQTRVSNSESTSSSPTQSMVSSVSSLNSAAGNSVSSRSVPHNLNTLHNLSDEPPTVSVEEAILLEFNHSRVPSFTDRILYQSRLANGDSDLTDGAIKCKHYLAIRSISSSDHKPVNALFEVSLDSGGPRIPFRLKKLSQIVDGLKTKVLSGENSFDQSNDSTEALSPSPASNKNLSFFGRRLGKSRSRGKLKDTRHGGSGNGLGQSISMSALPSESALARLDKLTRLNAGAFERQVFIDGLRLRNSFFSGTTISEFKKKHTFGLFKSRSFDSNVVESSTSPASTSTPSTIQTGNIKSADPAAIPNTPPPSLASVVVNGVEGDEHTSPDDPKPSKVCSIT